MAGYIWRPARIVDAAAIHRMLQAVDMADGTELAGVLEDVERNFQDSWTQAEKDSVLGMLPDGTVVAMGWVFMNPEEEQVNTAYLWLDVHPDYREEGLDDVVLSWLEARGEQRLYSKPADRQSVLRSDCPELQHGRIALLERNGFQPVRYFFEMRRDVSLEIPKAGLPVGLTLYTYRPEWDKALRDAFNDSFRDHWNFVYVSEDDWQLFFTGRSAFRTDITFLAMASKPERGGEVIAGFVINSVSPEENERYGIREGRIGQLGVLRSWRKRGVATALLCRTLEAFRSEGLDYASLRVDAENSTGALRLYERLGFETVKRYVAFSKTISIPGEN
jgi:mycothiol synthase